MTVPTFNDAPPQLESITDYDKRHFVTYLRLLDAAAEGADWREAVSIIFDIDPTREPDRAKRIHHAHLTRAQWMTKSGYKHLLRSSPD
jgi:hypothetical protein